MAFRPILLACAGAGLAACAASPRAASSAKVVGGAAAADGAWPTVVAIHFDGFLCTGTLVAPSLVISAAHCLDHHPADGSSPVVTLGNQADTGDAHQVAKFAANPNWDKTALTDYSYLVLKDPIANVTLIPVLTDATETAALLAPGTPASVVGFGQDDNGQAGVKREAVTQVDASVGGALVLGGNGKDTCFGDSGGPAFGQLANGEWRVYGITSLGFSKVCGGGTEDARIADGLCWIQQDSGVQVPGSTLACGTGPAGGGAGGGGGTSGDVIATLGHDLYMALGPDATGAGDTFTLYVAAPAGTASVSLCFGDAAACTKRPTEDLGFRLVKSVGTLAYFASTKPLRLASGSQATLLGFDATGAETEAQAVQFNSK